MRELTTVTQVEAEVQKLSAIQRETMAEEQYAVVLQYHTYTDLFPAAHKSEARSVAKQFDVWVKSGQAPDQSVFLHDNCKTLVSYFEDYVIKKYDKKPKDRLRWEAAFASPMFRSAVEHFLAQKVFEVKNERCIEGKMAFFSVAGRTSFVIQSITKQARAHLNEAFNRGYKIKDSNPEKDSFEAGKIAAQLTCEQIIASEDRIVRQLMSREPVGLLALN